jgi:hypothetical protein
MRFYNRQHRHYCGIDLHVKTMYVCILDTAGEVPVHRNVKSTPEALLEIIAPYREDLVVAAECMFTWYWLADVCAAEGIALVLGHALAMKAIHGGKAKTTRSTRTRSRASCADACCRRPTSMLRTCAWCERELDKDEGRFVGFKLRDRERLAHREGRARSSCSRATGC